MLRASLLLLSVLLTHVTKAQNLALNQLIKLYKQDFNTSSGYFTDNNWQLVESSKDQGSTDGEFAGYSADWEKNTSTEHAKCSISYKHLKSINEDYKIVSYLFTSKENFTQIRKGVEAMGYKADQPVIINNKALSAYTNGTDVFLLGVAAYTTNETFYIVRVMNYAFYYVKYLRK